MPPYRNPDDYAVVVGIKDYPHLGFDRGPAHLNAAALDAIDISVWLGRNDGGGLNPDHVRTIHSGDFVEELQQGNPLPNAQRIREAWRWLYGMSEAKRKAGKGTKVGRRLYIYMSGHGFGPKMREGALFTADAEEVDPVNCYASGWLEWFQENGYFDEYVLWLDCCMDRQILVTTEATFRRGGGVMTPPKATGIYFAARPPLKTVERPIAADGGRVHGVFTWTLLQGLAGAAADPGTGEINADNLANYMIHRIKDHLTPQDLNDPDISKEPNIVARDAGLVFVPGRPVGAAPPAARTTAVTLHFPPGSDQAEAIIWSGAPAQPKPVRVAGAQATVELTGGVHIVTVPAKGIRHAIEVSPQGAESFSISESGPAVVPPAAGQKFTLEVFPGNPAAEVFCIGCSLNLIDRGRGKFMATLESGVYKLKIRIGRDSHEVSFLLDRDVTFAPNAEADKPIAAAALQIKIQRPRLATAVPLPGNARIHEYHVTANQWADVLAVRPPVIFGAGLAPASAEIRLMARVWTERNGPASAARPWERVQLLDGQDRVIAQLSDGIVLQRNDPLARTRVEVIPGHYFLRQKLEDGRQFEQSLIVAKDWAFEAFLLAVESAEAPGKSSVALARCSLLMRQRFAQHPDQYSDEIVEAARVALADERSILNEDLDNLLLRKFDNPLAGIIGAHLLILEAERTAGGEKRLSLLNEVVPNLRTLVGMNHPDVEALSLRCPDPALRTSWPFAAPPIFCRSWALMVEAAAREPQLVPMALWQRIHAIVPAGAYLAWATDPKTKGKHQEQLLRWIEAQNDRDDSDASPPPFAAPAMAGGEPPNPAGPTALSLKGRGTLAAAGPSPTAEPADIARQLGIPLTAASDLLSRARRP